MVELSEPCTRRLFETIERSMQLTNQTKLPFEEQTHEVASCTLPVLDHHAEKHF